MIARSLLACLLVSGGIAAAKKRFDERGNLIPEKGEKAEQPAAVLPVADQAGKSGPDGAAGEPQAAPPGAPASETAEAQREEAAALAARKNPLTKVYLENAQLYLRSNRSDKALEFLRKSQEAGEDDFSREARLTALWLRARRGDPGLEGEAESSDAQLKMPALLRIADGYYACAREALKKNDCMNEAERLYAYASELQPRSAEGMLARLRLGLLLLDTGRPEAALPHLTQTLLAETADPKTNQVLREIPMDRAWFSLGQLYERPWYHRDTHKAEAAYKQVLKYTASPYHTAARERLAALQRFGTGYPRP